MFVFSQGAVRAIGVGANPLFLVFLLALYLPGAPSFPAAPWPGQAAGRCTGVCSLPPPRALGMLSRCPATAWMGLLWLL